MEGHCCMMRNNGISVILLDQIDAFISWELVSALNCNIFWLGSSYRWENMIVGRISLLGFWGLKTYPGIVVQSIEKKKPHYFSGSLTLFLVVSFTEN